MRTLRKPARIVPHQPIVGKARDDAPAHQHDEAGSTPQCDANAILCVSVNRFPSKWNTILPAISTPSMTRTRRLRQLLPATTSRKAIAARIARKAMSITAAIHCAPNRGARNRQTACKPKGEQAGQRIAVNRKPPGPIRNCGEQKAGDNRRDIAVDHLMDMPIQRIKSVGSDISPKYCGSQSAMLSAAHAAPPKKNGRKPYGENRRASVFKAALQRGGLVHHELLVSHSGHHLAVIDFWIRRAFNAQNADQSALKSLASA